MAKALGFEFAAETERGRGTSSWNSLWRSTRNVCGDGATCGDAQRFDDDASARAGDVIRCDVSRSIFRALQPSRSINGNAWTTNAGNNTLAKEPAAGGAPTAYSGNGLTSPKAVSIDGTGNVFVTNTSSVSSFHQRWYSPECALRRGGCVDCSNTASDPICTNRIKAAIFIDNQRKDQAKQQKGTAQQP